MTVIVPVKDDETRLGRCLAAVRQQDYEGTVEVIVVDNGSERSPTNALQYCPHARLIEELSPGSYAARNRAVSCAEGGVLAFTDADCIPDPSWITAGVHALRVAGDRAFVGGAIQVYASDPAHPSPAETYELATAFQQERYIAVNGFAATANMLVRTVDFLSVGPFDERLTAGGDREWGQRATRAGLSGTYAAAAVVRHPARATLRELWRKRTRIEDGHSRQRILEGRRLSTYQVVRAFRPPVHGMLDYARASPDRRLVKMAQVAGITFVLHYVSAFKQLLNWPSEHRSSRLARP